MARLSGEPTALRYAEGQDVRRHRSARGAFWYWRISPTVYATEVRGHLDLDMAHLLVDQVEPAFAGGGVITGFHNWLEMAGYDSRCRIDLTTWVMRHRPNARLCIALRSKIVSMGVSVANLALGDVIKTFSSVAAIEAELDLQLRHSMAVTGRGAG